MSIFTKIKAVGKTGLAKGKKYSPELLMGAGGLLFIATIYTTAKATIKVKDISKEQAELIEQTDVAAAEGDMVNPDGTLYSKEDRDHDKKVINVQYGLKKAKAIAAPATTAVLSLLCFGVAFHIVKKRYLLLMSAYKGLEASYNLLYSNVEKEYGAEKAFELANGLKKVGEDENGNGIYTKTNDSPVAAPYVEYITPRSCKYWAHNEWENDVTVSGVENNANELRGANGYLLWHDLCKELGLRKIKPISTRVGWVFDEKRRQKALEDGLNPDGYVDLRITKLYYKDEVDKLVDLPTDEERQAYGDWMDELFFNDATGMYEDYIYMINPNVDGEIYKYI